MQHKDTSSIVLKSLVSLTIAPVLLIAVFVATRYDKTLAQSPAPSQTFPLPSSLPNGTTVRLDGSSGMMVVNGELKRRFEEKFPGSVISLSSNGSDAALQALQKGEIDLAAIGRPLTEAEKAQGLTETSISREKIALIVGSANPFKGSITDSQFVRIFRGEIKNWSELGGPDVPIRVIDRPASSDTRQALSQYPGFNSGPMQAGANSIQVPQDDTAAVIRELGSDGISYAIANQVVNQPTVAALPMDDILPTDPRYPYSQPRNYVYRGQPNPGVIAFLGLATSASGQEAVQQANQQEITAIQGNPGAPGGGTTTPAATAAPAPAPEGGFDLSSLWWLLIPLLGLPLLFWWMKTRGAAAPGAVAPPRSSRMILVARNCRDAYAYWEVPSEAFEEARRQGGRDLKVRLHDVTDGSGLDGQAPHKVQEFSCSENTKDLHIPVDVDDRTYAAELGYVTDAGQWLRITHSDPVHVPACVPRDRAGVRTATTANSADEAARLAAANLAPDAGGARSQPLPEVVTGELPKVGGATLAGGAAAVAGASPMMKTMLDQGQSAERRDIIPPPVDCRITLMPLNDKEAHVHWDIAETYRQALQNRGGRKLTLRIYDTTNGDITHSSLPSIQTYDCSETEQDKQVSIPASDRDYVADLGYFTDDNRWLRLARSAPVHVAAAP